MSRHAWPWLAAVLCFVGLAVASGHFAFDVRRAITLPVVNPAPLRQRLLRCSNIDQTVDAPGVTDQPAETPGWSMFVADGQSPAVVTVTLRKQADRVVFYPRLGNDAASVTVEEPIGAFRRMLVSISTWEGQWTPIGSQYPLCLGCVENGWSDETFPVTLRVTLTGQGTQLWHKGETVFFEVP